MFRGLVPLMTYVQCIQPTQQEAEEEAKILRASLPSRNGITCEYHSSPFPSPFLFMVLLTDSHSSLADLHPTLFLKFALSHICPISASSAFSTHQRSDCYTCSPFLTLSLSLHHSPSLSSRPGPTRLTR